MRGMRGVASIQNTEKHCSSQEECANSLNAPDRRSSANMTVNVYTRMERSRSGKRSSDRRFWCRDDKR
jgi:hypothetical protein